MRRREGISPVLLELIVVVLFFALTMSVAVQLLAAADALSKKSAAESAAVIALTDLVERIKADPENAGGAGGSFDENGVCTVTETADGLSLTAVIAQRAQATGVYYEITATAAGEGGPAGEISAGCYVRGAGE